LEDEHQNGSLTAEDIDDKVSNSASKTQMEKERKRKQKAQIINAHPDIIGDTFWTAHPYILASKRGQDYGE